MSDRVPCPECYGGHFRPCQLCGDLGVLDKGHGSEVPSANSVTRESAGSKSFERPAPTSKAPSQDRPAPLDLPSTGQRSFYIST